MSNPEEKAKPAHNPMRLAILLGVLGLGAVLLGYDYFVARPACDAGYTTMHHLLEKAMTAKADSTPIGPATVQKTLGFGPSASEKKHDRYLIETYTWRGGLPFRGYNVFVVYRGLENPVLQNVTQNEYPPDDVIPSRTVKTDIEAATKAADQKARPDSPTEKPPQPTSSNPKTAKEPTGAKAPVEEKSTPYK